MPLKWEGPADPQKFETFTCRICGAVIGIRWGVSVNPTDTADLHIAYHAARGDEGDV